MFSQNSAETLSNSVLKGVLSWGWIVHCRKICTSISFGSRATNILEFRIRLRSAFSSIWSRLQPLISIMVLIKSSSDRSFKESSHRSLNVGTNAYVYKRMLSLWTITRTHSCRYMTWLSSSMLMSVFNCKLRSVVTCPTHVVAYQIVTVPRSLCWCNQNLRHCVVLALGSIVNQTAMLFVT